MTEQNPMVIKVKNCKRKAKAIVDYIAQLVKQLGNVAYHGFPEDCVTLKQRIGFIQALMEEAPKNARAASIVHISAPEGVGLTPRMWEEVRERVWHHVSEFASMDKRVKAKHGKWTHVREPVDLDDLVCVAPVHDDTANQHAQILIVWRHPTKNRQVIINGSKDWPVWDLAMRRVEREFGLPTNGNNLEPGVVTMADGRRVVMVKRSEEQQKSHDKKQRNQNSPEQQAIRAHRGATPPAETLREVLRGYTPTSRDEVWEYGAKPALLQSWEDLARVLAKNNAGLERRGSGGNFFVDGQECKSSSLAKATDFTKWRYNELVKLWGVPPQRVIGVDEAAQKQASAADKDWRVRLSWTWAGGSKELVEQITKTIAARSQEYVHDLIAKGPFSLPCDEVSWVARSVDGSQSRPKTMTTDPSPEHYAELLATVEHLLKLEGQGYDVMIQPRAVQGECLLRFGRISQDNLTKLKAEYKHVYALQAGPDEFWGVIRSRSLGDPVADKLAVRMLEKELAHKYGGVIADSGMPLVGLHRTASNGYLTRHESRAWELSPVAHERLAQLWRERSLELDRMLRGPALRMAEKLQIPARQDRDLAHYRAHLLEVANTVTIRCHDEREVNYRVALRLIRGGMPEKEVEVLVQKGAEAAALTKTEWQMELVAGPTQNLRKRKKNPDVIRREVLRDFRAEAERALDLAKDRAAGLEESPKHRAFVARYVTPAPELAEINAENADTQPEQERGVAPLGVEVVPLGLGDRVRVPGRSQAAKKEEAEPEKKRTEQTIYAPIQPPELPLVDEEAEIKKKKKRKAEAKAKADQREREQWMRERIREITENPIDPFLGVARERELLEWQAGTKAATSNKVGPGPRPKWLADLEAEWRQVAGTKAGTMEAVKEDQRRRAPDELGLHMSRLEFARQLIDADPAEKYSRQVDYFQWITGQSQAMPEFLAPLLGFQPEPQRLYEPPDPGPRRYLGIEEEARHAAARMEFDAFHNNKHEALTLFSALMKLGQVDQHIITGTAAQVMQQTVAVIEGLVTRADLDHVSEQDEQEQQALKGAL